MHIPQSPLEIRSSSCLWSRLLIGLLAVGMAVPTFAGYREDHIELFRITEPPLITDYTLVSDFGGAEELVLGWNSEIPDEIAVQIIASFKSVVQVVVLAQSAADISQKQITLANYGVPSADVNFEIVETDSPWVGDYGPLAIQHSSTANISLVDPRYLDPRPLDDKVPTELAANRFVNVFRPSVLLPRGVITNGWGTCLLSERDALDSLPDPDDAALVALMEDYFGCTQVAFLPSIVNSGNGDLSQALNFVDSNTVLVGELTGDVDCVNADRLDAIAATVDSLLAPGGGTLEVVRIPFPPDTDGVFRSYTDFVMANGTIAIPTFPDFPYDSQALAIFNQVLPSWTHVPIEASAMESLEGGFGSLVSILPSGIYTLQQAPPALVCGDQPSCQAIGCGNVTLEGLCTNETVVWCQDMQIFTTECSTPCFFTEPGSPCEMSCGWAPAGYYDCLGNYECGRPEIFFGGFETGDVTAWSASSLTSTDPRVGP